MHMDVSMLELAMPLPQDVVLINVVLNLTVNPSFLSLHIVNEWMLVVYHLRKSGWKVNGTRHLQRKISGCNGTPDKVRKRYGNSRSISSKPSLIPVSGLCGRFAVNG